MKNRHMKRKLKIISSYLLCEFLILGTFPQFTFAENASNYVSVPPLINTSSSGDKSNVLFILDNSNSMDEAPTGQAVGSANAGSKSEIARNAIKDIIDTFGDSSRMGLMAYQQSGLSVRRLHDSQYDASFDPSNYDPDFNGDRASQTKRFRIPNPADAGGYIHYNIALPFYSGSNAGTKFCYSTTADFDNGSEDPVNGPWDTYSCYNSKTGTSDGFNGYSSYSYQSRFSPTDSDYAQNILDFGTNLTWQYVSRTWFSNSSPGKGYLHVEIGDVDASHKALLENKLATSQFSSYTDTPLRNAGLTPIRGSLQSALDYFNGSLAGSQSATGSTPSAPQPNACGQQDYVILVTDGLPSVDANGNAVTNTSTAIANAAAEAANLLAGGIKTYVIGFALPAGVDGSLLDTIATSGGTGATYLAGDSEELLNSLQSIFLSFENTDASSSSSAVLANNSRGEGAVFQAVYSPQKEDNSGNEVSWVGSLFGLFLDENGFIREDTNQNAQLDGYDQDRVAEYYYDTALRKTQVRLFTGAGASSAPDTDVDTPSATVDVEDLKTIWEARDELGEISDVLTQRSYEASASTGRYIITSVDGSSAVDFIQISDDAIAALVAVQNAAAAALADAQADLNVSQAQFDGATNAVDDMVNQRDAAQSLRDDAQTTVNTAETTLASAEASLTTAQTNLTAAEDAFNATSQDYTDHYADRFNALNTAINTTYQNSLDNLLGLSPSAEFNDLINWLVVEEGADITDATVIAARDALNQAMSDYNNLLNEVNNQIGDYSSDVSDAESDLRSITDALAATGDISGGDRADVLAVTSFLYTTDYSEFSQANSNYTTSAVAAAQSALATALIDTGVNENKGPVRSRIDAYDSARAAEAVQEAALNTAFDTQIYSTTTDFFDPHRDLVGDYDSIVTNENNVTNAQNTVNTAQTALTDAEGVLSTREGELAQAETDLLGAQNLLDPVEESYNTFLAAYNTALNAYNQATATVNNSGTLINYLDVPTLAEAYNTVKFVRGEDGIAGTRSRSIDYDNDGTEEVWRLGDIVHSSPALVGAPNARYDILHRDQTYIAFREKYKNRRQVLYVGSNDGMLHAFNAGFWNLSDKKFETTNTFAGGSGVTAHPLGSELWSYVPRSALPHLQWLTDPNYAHTYYVDGDPITFDANIFTEDATHPNGWGTVLMIGMRFGGSPIDVDADSDGTDDTTVYSSYSLFDVTDPEQAPVLIAELSSADMGYTTSIPTVVKKRVKGTSFASPTQNEWYVAFGSGPNQLSDASSTNQAGLFLYDLASRSYKSGFGPLLLTANSFIGDITSFDDGDNYVDDTLYFGLSGGSPSGGSNGSLYRTRLDQAAGLSTSRVINNGEPIISSPTITNDQFGRRWITYGTGRLFMAPDNITTQARHYYGVMEPVDSSGDFTWASQSSANLENVTSIEVRDTGAISRGGSTVQIPSGSDVDTFDELIQAIRENRAGWKIDLPTGGINPSSRNLSKGSLGGNVLFFTSYQPAPAICSPEGTSRLYGVDVRTGTAIPFEVFDVDSDPNVTQNNVVDAYISLGEGLASAPIVLRNSNGSTVFTSKSTTEQINTNVRTGVYRTGRQSWRQLLSH